MNNRLKTLARDMLPKRCQVPAKYWYSRFRGALEEETKLLGLIVRNHDRVVDVGGNRGIYAYQLWQLGARVEVFEPNPTCFRALTACAARIKQALDCPIPRSLLAEAVRLFEEGAVLERHFEVLGLKDR